MFCPCSWQLYQALKLSIVCMEKEWLQTALANMKVDVCVGRGVLLPPICDFCKGHAAFPNGGWEDAFNKITCTSVLRIKQVH